LIDIYQEHLYNCEHDDFFGARGRVCGRSLSKSSCGPELHAFFTGRRVDRAVAGTESPGLRCDTTRRVIISPSGGPTASNLESPPLEEGGSRDVGPTFASCRKNSRRGSVYLGMREDNPAAEVRRAPPRPKT